MANPRAILNEFSTKTGLKVAINVERASGPDHVPLFEAEVSPLSCIY